MSVPQVFKSEKAQHVGLGILAGVVLFGGGYATAIYTRPAHVEYHSDTKIQEVEKQVVVVQEKVVTQKVYVQNEQQHIHRENHEVKHPDGTDEKFSTEDINTSNVIEQHDIQYVDRDVLKTLEHTTVQEKVVDKIVQADNAQWRAALTVGIDFRKLNAFATPLPGSLFDNPFVVGAQVERRIIGPVWVGLYGNTASQAGLVLSFEW